MCLPYVCSLKADVPQDIPADGRYHLVRFPYGVESYDVHGMHEPVQPDGVVSTDGDDRAGLIWPAVAGWASLYAMAQWAPGDYTELRDRFVRDPLDLTTGFDSTATEDYPPTVGGQYRAKAWGMFVTPGTPLGLMVRHNAIGPVGLTLAEFKMVIHADPCPTPA